jgi:hypothetical protein
LGLCHPSVSQLTEGKEHEEKCTRLHPHGRLQFDPVAEW